MGQRIIFLRLVREQNGGLTRIICMDLSTLSDDELFGKVSALAETERFCITDFLLHLGELDRRPACEKRGYPSTFAYLTRELGYSESDAVRRVRVARASRAFPSILRMMARGDLHLVSVSMLQPLLTSKNHQSLLRQACRKSTREVEKMAASMLPAALEPRDRVRALPPCPAPEPALAKQAALPVEAAPETELSEYFSPAAAMAGADNAPRPRVCFTFAAPEEVRALFDEARDYLRHKFPSGRFEDVIGEALRLLVERERAVRTLPPRKSAGPKRKSRRVPRAVKVEVWRRDGGRCVFVGAGGVRCGERAWLEYDHVRPWASGGASDSPGNVRLLCRAHNQARTKTND